jgi:hypothetical protein
VRTEQEARREGRKLLKRMKGKGWKLRVWENLGWHFCVWNGPAAVYPSINGKFHCLLADHDCKGTGAGHGEWTTTESFADPNKAVACELASAESVVQKYIKALKYIKGVLKN